MGEENDTFWFEISSGFGELGSTLPPRIHRGIPPPPPPPPPSEFSGSSLKMITIEYFIVVFENLVVGKVWET